MATYAQFQEEPASNKIILVQLDSAKRLMGWTLHSGVIYKITSFTYSVIVTLEDTGTALSSVGSIGAITAGSYFHDRANQTLYARCSDGANPNSKFMALTFRSFYADAPVRASHDLSTGFDVEWLALVSSSSNFGFKLDNQGPYIGNAVEGSGSITFHNDFDYWSPRYDKLTYENKACYIYSWSNSLPITEAKLIYKGKITSKSWTSSVVSFQLRDLFSDLKAPISLSNMQDVSGARIPEGLYLAKQRRIYGQINGYRPTNIDQILDGYPLTGTVSLTVASATVTGSGTSFLTELKPNDKLIITGATEEYTVKSITSNTSLTLSDTFDETANLTGVAFSVLPERAKRYINRVHFIAGHPLREASTTVVTGLNSQRFTVADSTDFEDGDPILVGSELSTIDYVSDNTIKLTLSLAAAPATSTVVKRPPVHNAKIDNNDLVYIRDYTVNSSTAKLTLDPLAEFNIAPKLALPSGTVAFTNTSRAVTGTSTKFTTELMPGDWIKASTQADYFEVLQINSDTSLDLVSAATYTVSGVSAHYKSPDYYDEDQNILTISTRGCTELQQASTNTWLNKPAQIVEDILYSIGLTINEVNSTSFNDANEIAQHRIGLAIPEKFDDTDTGKYARDWINKINKSVFGSIIQNEDFKLEYKLLDPRRPTGALSLDHTEIFGFNITSDNSKIAKTIYINYDNKEADPITKEPSFSQESYTSDNANYLSKTDKETIIDTYLIRQSEAAIMASRWVFLLEQAQNIYKIATKMRASRSSVGDMVDFSHPRLFQRLGSDTSRKAMGIIGVNKNENSVNIEMDDLGNAFTRVATITENTASDFSVAPEDELILNGYITDNYGMQSNDESTFNINLIW